jgi:hypothetical protein
MFDVPWFVQDAKQAPVEKYPVANGFVPVITEADIDAYLVADGHPTDEGDPRDGFDDTPWSMAKVLYFLGWVAQFKAMDAPQSDPGHFGYETMLYAYHDAADVIAAL